MAQIYDILTDRLYSLSKKEYTEKALYYFKLSDVYQEPYESRYMRESWYWLLMAEANADNI